MQRIPYYQWAKLDLWTSWASLGMDVFSKNNLFLVFQALVILQSFPSRLCFIVSERTHQLSKAEILAGKSYTNLD